MPSKIVLGVGTLALLSIASAGPARALPWAAEAIFYDPGTNPQPGFTDATVALGPPSRSTPGEFGGDVTPGSGPFLASQVVSIGETGELIVRFDAPVENDPLNPFGVDLLVFGNAFIGVDFSTGLATGSGGGFDEPGVIEVGQDGSTWFEVPGVFADTSLWPTMGYTDTPGFFGTDGVIETDFTRPVDPSLTLADLAGLDHAGVAALWGGSGGGAGVDLDAVGLPWIQYVRVTNPDGSLDFATEIDGFADVTPVPEPGSALLVAAGLAALARLRRRASSGPEGSPIPQRCPERNSS